MSRFRSTKKKVRDILAAVDWRGRLAELEEYRPGDLVAPLLNLRLDREEAVRWRSVAAFGLTADRLARASMEKARVLMRTLMWYMNEESRQPGLGHPPFHGRGHGAQRADSQGVSQDSGFLHLL